MCAFAERAVDVIAMTDGTLLWLVQLLCVYASAELRVAELTIDFWVGLQDTPLIERHEQLRQPLYTELLQRVLVQCTLPADFKSWDECAEVEEEDFTRFREQGASEVLGICLELLKAQFLSALRARLEPNGAGVSSWQQLELVLYVVRVLHADMKSLLSRELGEAADQQSSLLAQKQDAHEILGLLLSPISTNPLQDMPSPLQASAVRLVGSYGKWLATEQPTMVEGAVQFALQVLSSTSVAKFAAAEHAANAFKDLCTHAHKVLGKFKTVTTLIPYCEPHIRNSELPAELRVCVVEGLARLVGSFSSPEAAQEALVLLVGLPCSILTAIIGPGSSQPGTKPTRETSDAAALQITLLATAMRYCDRYKPGRHPVLPVLQGCWELIMRTAVIFRGEAALVQALCNLFGIAMTTLKRLMVRTCDTMLHRSPLVLSAARITSNHILLAVFAASNAAPDADARLARVC